MTVTPGTEVPAITAENQRGETVTVEFDEPTVVYFYPRDDTSGCTTEAQQFEAERETYSDAGVRVYGVSTDDVASHESFAEKHGLGFDLLADPDERIADAFDVETSGGRAERVTFVLADGEVKAVYAGVDPDGHAREVLSDVLDDGTATLEG